eukprot:TRINITY_DN1326_c0_g1_i1.p1 TRINITY_DN1326_c0_g1~~TRINITY_DN1326_c0_g1_i1.p1  ORF type:complete len:202 (-),score=48.13 TRINITY_DN1326_c0_g1_i1:41-646(-)
MKLILALFAVLVAIVTVEAGIACCVPSQWEGEAAGVFLDRKKNDTDAFFEYISYDMPNQRVRVDFYERIYHEHEIRRVEKTIIEKFEDGEYRLYTIDKKDNTCFYSRMNNPLKQVCIGDDYSAKYDFTIGGSLKATVYRFEHDIYRDDVVVTKGTCIPISGVQFEHHGRERDFDFKVDYWNVELGIRNPNIFDTPSGCRRQ